jgi:hypothetical protein
MCCHNLNNGIKNLALICFQPKTVQPGHRKIHVKTQVLGPRYMISECPSVQPRGIDTGCDSVSLGYPISSAVKSSVDQKLLMFIKDLALAHPKRTIVLLQLFSQYPMMLL